VQSRQVGDLRPTARSEGEHEGFRVELNSQREADRVTINKYSPPGVLVNAELQILQFRGPTSAFSSRPPGKASFDVLKMARQGLMLPLRAAINEAKKENNSVRRESVRVNQNGGTRTVNVEVVPLKNLRERCFLILFDDAERVARVSGTIPHEEPRGSKTPRSTSAKEESRGAALKRELAETRAYLQSVLEQHDAAYEELQASTKKSNRPTRSCRASMRSSKRRRRNWNRRVRS